MHESTAPVDNKILRRILRAIGTPPRGVYSPREDSYLMLDAISSIPLDKKEVLDVGTGSGILGLFCAMRDANVTVTDIDDTALLYAQKVAQTLGVGLKAVQSDLFSNVEGRFDLVLFNPPYLPSAALEDRTVDGGKKGKALASRFLKTLPTHLKIDGTTVMLLSSSNDPASLIEEHPEFDFSVVAKRALFFEELQALRLRFREHTAGKSTRPVFISSGRNRDPRVSGFPPQPVPLLQSWHRHRSCYRHFS